jgi:tetratricopeptide (TPR) repeat protein
MHRITILVVALMAPVSARLLEGDHARLTARVVDDIIDCRFTRAIATAESLSRADTLDPLGPLLHLLALGLRDVDSDRLLDSSAFLGTYAATMSRVERHERAHGRTSYSLTVAGIANTAHASFFLRQKQYFAAIGTGRDGLELLEGARELDTTNLEPDFFLGLYDYARGELKKRLWMVLFWYPGNKDRGIARLTACMNRAQLTATGAKMALADIYVKEEEFAKARALIDELRRSHPESRFVLWSRAKYHDAREEHEQAAEVYGRLAASYEQYPDGRYNGLVTRLKQVEALRSAGQRRKALVVARETIETNCSVQEERCGDVCEEIESMSRRLADDG